jgi:hypothetical protein
MMGVGEGAGGGVLREYSQRGDEKLDHPYRIFFFNSM